MKHSLQLRLSQHLTLTPQLQQSIRLLLLSTLLWFVPAAAQAPSAQPASVRLGIDVLLAPDQPVHVLGYLRGLGKGGGGVVEVDGGR